MPALLDYEGGEVGLAAHDAYQVDPIHKEFIEKFRTYWERVQIYDAE